MNPPQRTASLARLAFLFLGLLAQQVLLSGAGAAPPAPPALEFPKWKSGDAWNLAVVLFPRDLGKDQDPVSDPSLRIGFSMQVRIEGQEKVGPVACWKVVFTPGTDAPARFRNQRCFVLVDPATGWPRKVVHEKGGAATDIALRDFGAAVLPAVAPEGFPIEVFPFFEKRLLQSTGLPLASLILHKEKKADDLLLEARVEERNEEDLFVRQKWRSGATWWGEYERRVRGRKDLYAKVGADPGQLTTPIVDRGPPTPALTDPLPEPKGLRGDPRLRVRVTVEGTNPRLADVLARLQEATGLKMTLEEALARHDPAFGQVALRDAPAWSVMMMVAHAQLSDGRWEATEEGYRLRGQSLSQKPPEGGTPLWRRPEAITGITVAAAVLVLVLVLRRRGRKGPLVSADARTGPQPEAASPN
jgi:hypothetical protein